MTPTKEQDVVAAKKTLADLKLSYMTAIQNYTESKRLPELLACQQAGSAYFNFAEEFVGNSDLLGAHKSDLWAQGFAEDCAEILKSMPAHFTLMRIGFENLSKISLTNYLPGSTAYANMQRMVVRYLSKKEANNILKTFEENSLATYGFKNQAVEFMSRKTQTILSFGFGVLFLIAMLAISFIQPTPSSFQYTTFRTVLSLAGAGAVAVFPGFIELRFGTWLRAGGALAVFAALYFLNPAMLATTDSTVQRNATPSLPK